MKASRKFTGWRSSLEILGKWTFPSKIFPARLTTAGLDQPACIRRNRPGLVASAGTFKQGFDFFEAHHQPPVVRVDGGGRYAFSVK